MLSHTPDFQRFTADKDQRETFSLMWVLGVLGLVLGIYIDFMLYMTNPPGRGGAAAAKQNPVPFGQMASLFTGRFMIGSLPQMLPDVVALPVLAVWLWLPIGWTLCASWATRDARTDRVVLVHKLRQHGLALLLVAVLVGLMPATNEGASRRNTTDSVWSDVPGMVASAWNASPLHAIWQRYLSLGAQSAGGNTRPAFSTVQDAVTLGRAALEVITPLARGDGALAGWTPMVAVAAASVVAGYATIARRFGGRWASTVQSASPMLVATLQCMAVFAATWLSAMLLLSSEASSVADMPAWIAAQSLANWTSTLRMLSVHVTVFSWALCFATLLQAFVLRPLWRAARRVLSPRHARTWGLWVVALAAVACYQFTLTADATSFTVILPALGVLALLVRGFKPDAPTDEPILDDDDDD